MFDRQSGYHQARADRAPRTFTEPAGPGWPGDTIRRVPVGTDAV